MRRKEEEEEEKEKKERKKKRRELRQITMSRFAVVVGSFSCYCLWGGGGGGIFLYFHLPSSS